MVLKVREWLLILELHLPCNGVLKYPANKKTIACSFRSWLYLSLNCWEYCIEKHFSHKWLEAKHLLAVNCQVNYSSSVVRLLGWVHSCKVRRPRQPHNNTKIQKNLPDEIFKFHFTILIIKNKMRFVQEPLRGLLICTLIFWKSRPWEIKVGFKP